MMRSESDRIMAKQFVTKLPEYAVWQIMRRRCYDKNLRCYHRYGGRGIKVCERWRESFDSFFSDMGPRPSDKHQIDRINNEGNYEPDNCRWVTNFHNSRNRRSNVNITIDGVTRCLMDWVAESGNKYLTVYMRIQNGWDPRIALWMPAGQVGNGRSLEWQCTSRR